MNQLGSISTSLGSRRRREGSTAIEADANKHIGAPTPPTLRSLRPFDAEQQFLDEYFAFTCFCQTPSTNDVSTFLPSARPSEVSKASGHKLIIDAIASSFSSHEPQFTLLQH